MRLSYKSYGIKGQFAGGHCMLDIEYNGNKYKLVVDSALFDCMNVLFVGFLFIENKRYKKYINCNKIMYLLEV